ncbi:RdRP-domain-containing protein [Heliocybe sulcata]|uniref:RNA-dependent RNA polymerase n=1 Tax=Heliocybe sulcata TaxID=5364 RepID=A0A5C3NNA5_9AGAM|nr:RdRP-domain-containing protein [Heliocybe sulcata]
MEIFLRNIPLQASELEVTCAFARILHRPPFRAHDEDPLMNFDVRLLKKRSRARDRLGNLTVPTVEVGESLLQLYRYIHIRDQAVSVNRSNRAVNSGTLRRILSVEWEDPDVLREREAVLASGSTPITLKSYAFGRLRKDHVFSPEVTYAGECSVILDMVKRRLVLVNVASSSIDLDILFSEIQLDQSTRSEAFFPAHKIGALARAGPLDIVVEAETPPVMGRKQESSIFDDLFGDQSRPSRVGEDTLRYVGRHFSLSFKDQRSMSTFWERCVQLQLRFPAPSPQTVTIRPLGIYSRGKLDTLHEVLGSLNFEIAFEAQKAVFGGVLEPAEVTQLHSVLKRFGEAHGAEFADIFRVFTANLERVHLTPGRRRRRGRRPARGSQEGSNDVSEANRPSFESQLADAEQLYLEQLQRPRHRLQTLSTSSVLRSFFLIVTPSTMILEGPLPDQGNSVLRRFGHHESFLRVTFEDEDRSKMRPTPDMDISELLRQRFRTLLVEGFQIAGRRYEFLGYSMSGLRQHSVWFVSPYRADNGILMNAAEIRRRLGDFSGILSYKPARLAARWAQAFSTSDPSVTLEDAHIRRIADRHSANGSCFTDGCGTISSELLRESWSFMRRAQGSLSGLPRPPPSLLQIRYGGYKGTVVEDNRVQGKMICLRPSQRKFDAPTEGTLDVTGTSFRPIRMFLNRPLIVLMEYQGVSQDHIFRLQEAAIADVHKIFTSFSHASFNFESHGLGSSFHLPALFKRLHAQLNMIPYSTSAPNGLRHELLDICLCYGATQILREIKYRARIPVPGSFTLFGVSDEWDCLNEGEIFATVYDYRTGEFTQIEGQVLITRSPQIHPGDLQLVTAVRRPQLEHLKNVVVFSCRGHRSLASCLAGGDLDGDIFNLILDPGLMPERVSAPGAYESLGDKTLDRPCTVEDIADFVIDYIKSDLLGQISILHLRIADLENAGHNDCIKLAVLASQAVDFPKTGKPVNIDDLPIPPSNVRPDFLAREGTDPNLGKKFYPSARLLGRLFRNVPMDIPPSDEQYVEPTHVSKIRAALPAVSRPPPDLKREMQDLLEAYRDQLYTIAHANSLSPREGLSEGELVSGTIQDTWNDHHKRRDAMTVMNFQTHELVKVIRREFRGDLERRTQAQGQTNGDGELEDEDSDEEDDEDERREETLRRAYAAWIVAEEAVRKEPAGFGIQSFGLIALGTILDMLAEEARR